MNTPLPLDARIYVAGHRGLVGSAIVRLLQERGFTGIITRTSAELDLRNQAATQAFFESEQPQYVFLSAAKVGGIQANIDSPGLFIYDNVMISANVIEAARLLGVTKLLNLGSSCVYPREAPQPLKEEYMLTGPLEPTNHAYAVAKIAAAEQCTAYRKQYGCNFITANPTNIYGQGDNFDARTSHVLSGLVRRIIEAKESGASQIEIWGTGKPHREFLYVDDLADACLFLMENYEGEIGINVGTGRDISIADLAALIKEIVGYEGDLAFDTTKPDGMMRKLLDVSRLDGLGWQAKVSLREGIERTVEWYLNNRN